MKNWISLLRALTMFIVLVGGFWVILGCDQTVLPTTPSGQPAASLNPSASAAAVNQLESYLTQPYSNRATVESQAFATVALTRADAETAAGMLWDDFADNVRNTRRGETGATETSYRTISVNGHSMRYYMATRGSSPPGGRSLFISMHGGGNAPARTNDQQWLNQIRLVSGYNPQDALWVAPRAPSNDWNMWFTPEVDELFERLITNMIVFEGVNPNKIYINGYSAGGDAVYQLGPRMADHWAGAGMSAGHPNDASPVNLRNVAFAIHAGARDTSYERNLKAEEWGRTLDRLAAEDPGGYPHQWQVHPGLPHWMELADAVSIPFLQRYTRNPVPSKVVWRQVAVTKSRFYWLAVDESDRKAGTEVRAEYAGNRISLTQADGLQRLRIRFSDAMMNMDQPIQVDYRGAALFNGTVPRTIAVIARTLSERGDPTMSFCGEITVNLN